MISILVVEDDPDVLGVLGELFEDELGVRTLPITSLEELTSQSTAALECELAIVDLHLGPFGPAPEGLAALRWLRERGYQRKVLITTGSQERITDAERLGPMRVVPKPYEFAELLELVQEALGNAD